jgi:hypothetical protein
MPPSVSASFGGKNPVTTQPAALFDCWSQHDMYSYTITKRNFSARNLLTSWIRFPDKMQPSNLPVLAKVDAYFTTTLIMNMNDYSMCNGIQPLTVVCTCTYYWSNFLSLTVLSEQSWKTLCRVCHQNCYTYSEALLSQIWTAKDPS